MVNNLKQIIKSLCLSVLLNFSLSTATYADVIDTPEHTQAEKIVSSIPNFSEKIGKMMDVDSTAKCWVVLSIGLGKEMSGELKLNSTEKLGYAMLYELVQASYFYHSNLGKQTLLQKKIELYDSKPNVIHDSLACFGYIQMILK